MSIIEKVMEKSGRTDKTPPTRVDVDKVAQVWSKDQAVEEKFSNIGSLNEDGEASRRISLNRARLSNNGMLLPDDFETQLAEEYRRIKRPLLQNAFGDAKVGIKNSNLVMITSCLPGEGKSFTSINLAISVAAERERTVLLVDADVSKPSIPEFMGFEPGLGLIDLLADDAVTFNDVLHKTDIPNLSLISAGKKHKYSTEILASDAMARLAMELSSRYSDRLVIFDSPPLLNASQAAVLANQVGQVILVVEAGKTPQSGLKQAISMIDSCDVIGFIINKRKKATGMGFLQDYGYGYGYGYAESQQQ